MAALLLLLAIATIAIVATIVSVMRDGYSRVAIDRADERKSWPSMDQPTPTRLA